MPPTVTLLSDLADRLQCPVDWHGSVVHSCWPHGVTGSLLRTGKVWHCFLPSQGAFGLHSRWTIKTDLMD